MKIMKREKIIMEGPNVLLTKEQNMQRKKRKKIKKKKKEKIAGREHRVVEW